MTTCSKVRYGSEAEAKTALVNYVRRFGARGMGAYRCQVCRTSTGRRLWHIGHRSGRSNPRWARLA